MPFRLILLSINSKYSTFFCAKCKENHIFIKTWKLSDAIAHITEDHFREVPKMVELGSGSNREILDLNLCNYLSFILFYLLNVLESISFFLLHPVLSVDIERLLSKSQIFQFSIYPV